MSTTWFDGSITGYEAADLGPLFLRQTLGWYPVSYYGAKMDLRRTGASMTIGTPTASGTFLASDGDAGKRAFVVAAGSVVATASDGAMSVAFSPDRNVLTSATASFTPAMLGRQLTVTGAGSGGATLTSTVWGIISPTQIRLRANASTTVTNATYTIVEHLYATVLASSASGATLDTNASQTVTSATCWVGTDDAPAINLAITDALLDAPTAAQLAPPTIYLERPLGIASPIETYGRIHMRGGGLSGFSGSLTAHGSTRIRALAPKLQAFFRYAPPGSGLGLRGSITSGTKTLTDPDGTFVAGDVGKQINVIGAGVQVGSQTRVSLVTTIQFVDSATQIRLTANASTTVTEATYSWVGTGVTNQNNAFGLERLHFVGAVGQMCAIHAMDANEYELTDVTASDFTSGIGHYADGTPGNTQYMTINNFTATSGFIGLKGHTGVLTLSGTTVLDGNNNNVSVTPGPGSIGVDCDGLRAPGSLTIQAFDLGVRSDGGTSDPHVNADDVRLEACVTGFQLGGDSNLGGNGSTIKCSSWSTSGIGGSTRFGLALLAGSRNTVFTPGYYLPSNINMYGACDATSLQTCITHDPQSPMNTGGVSTTTPGAVSTVNIAHGLRATPTRFSAERGDANARGAPAYYVTVTSTNVVLNFASALTAATPYTWNWTAGI